MELKSFAPDVLYAFAYHNDHPGTFPYHQHDFIEISTMLSGYSDYNIEGRHTRITAGQVLVFNPGVHHQETQPPHSQSLQLHIGLRRVALPGMAPEHLPFAEQIVTLGDQQAAYLACAKRIVAEENKPRQFGHDVLVQALVVELLCLLMRALPANAVAADPVVVPQTAGTTAAQQALVSAAVYAIESRYDTDLTLSSLAASLHVSAAHLSRTFKAVRGETVTTFLTRTRLNKANQMLHDTDRPVHEVAHAVGYQDPFYFSRLFKRHFGAAPSLSQK